MTTGARAVAEAGGLMSYGADVFDAFRHIGLRTLKGAKPADLPIVQSTKFELVINLKTVKALGVKISDSAAPLDLLDDRQHIGRKPPRIRLYSGRSRVPWRPAERPWCARMRRRLRQLTSVFLSLPCGLDRQHVRM